MRIETAKATVIILIIKKKNWKQNNEGDEVRTPQNVGER
jgi:hypothetical protein